MAAFVRIACTVAGEVTGGVVQALQMLYAVAKGVSGDLEALRTSMLRVVERESFGSGSDPLANTCSGMMQSVCDGMEQVLDLRCMRHTVQNTGHGYEMQRRTLSSIFQSLNIIIASGSR